MAARAVLTRRWRPDRAPNSGDSVVQNSGMGQWTPAARRTAPGILHVGGAIPELASLWIREGDDGEKGSPSALAVAMGRGRRYAPYHSVMQNYRYDSRIAGSRTLAPREASSVDLGPLCAVEGWTSTGSESRSALRAVGEGWPPITAHPNSVDIAPLAWLPATHPAVSTVVP